MIYLQLRELLKYRWHLSLRQFFFRQGNQKCYASKHDVKPFLKRSGDDWGWKKLIFKAHASRWHDERWKDAEEMKKYCPHWQTSVILHPIIISSDESDTKLLFLKPFLEDLILTLEAFHRTCRIFCLWTCFLHLNLFCLGFLLLHLFRKPQWQPPSGHIHTLLLLVSALLRFDFARTVLGFALFQGVLAQLASCTLLLLFDISPQLFFFVFFNCKVFFVLCSYTFSLISKIFHPS